MTMTKTKSDVMIEAAERLGLTPVDVMLGPSKEMIIHECWQHGTNLKVAKRILAKYGYDVSGHIIVHAWVKFDEDYHECFYQSNFNGEIINHD